MYVNLSPSEKKLFVGEAAYSNSESQTDNKVHYLQEIAVV